MFPMDVSFPGLGLDFKVDNVAFRIGDFAVYWYALIILCGFLLAVTYAFRNGKRFGIDTENLLDIVIVGLLCAIIGARTYYVIFHLDYYDSFLEAINIRDGGLGIYGGVIFAFLSGWLMCRRKDVHVLSLFDVVGTGFLIGQGIGRWGNFVNQEAFGTQTDLPWGMVSANTGNVPVHPCFLYESIWCLGGFLMLNWLSKRWYKFRGQYFLLYLAWYGLGRAWIEGLRTDSLYLVPGVIRVSQLLAALCVVVTVPILVLQLTGKINWFRLAAENTIERWSDTVDASEVVHEELTFAEEWNRDIENIKSFFAKITHFFAEIFKSDKS